MTCAIAIFVKTPGLSPVKSRLWPELGRETAERLYLASAAAVRSVVELASAQADLTGYWATAESVSDVSAEWPGLEHVDQGEGGLGSRMATVYCSLQAQHGGAILIGADAPQIEARQLVGAASWLRSTQPRLVIGRAHDGGFWLFGGNTRLQEDAWNRVEYSTAKTANAFVRAMGGNAEWLELAELQDIDIADDLEPVRRQLLALEQPTTEQARFSRLLGETGKIVERCA